MTSQSSFQRIIVPSFILLLFSIAACDYFLKTFPTASKEKGLWPDLGTYCPELFNENHPIIRRLYFEGGLFGDVLCTIYGVLAEALKYGYYESESRIFILDSLMFFGLVGSFVVIESSRSSRPYPMSVSVLLTVVSQLFTGAVALPFFWMLLLWKQYKEGIPSSFNSVDAKSALAASILGYYIPSILFFIYPPSILVNTIWQLFPLNTLIVHKLSHIILASTSSKENAPSGGQLIKQFYLAAAIFGGILHFLLKWRPSSLGLSNLIPPSTSFLDPNKGDTFANASSLFLSWDAFFIYLESVLAISWAGDNLTEGVKILAWLVFTPFFLGPTAALSVFLYFREQKIERAHSVKAR